MEKGLKEIISFKNGYFFSFRNSLEKSASVGHITSQQSFSKQNISNNLIQKMQQTPKFSHQGIQFSRPSLNLSRRNRFLKHKDSLQSFGGNKQRNSTQPIYYNNNNDIKIDKIQINYNNFKPISQTNRIRIIRSNQNIRSRTISNPKITQSLIRKSNLNKLKYSTTQEIYAEKLHQRLLSKKSKVLMKNNSNNNITTTLPERLILIRNPNRMINQTKDYNRKAIIQKKLKNDKLKDLNQALKNT